jgi:hypothetical protein
MKTRTEIHTEYVPTAKTANGSWRPITVARFRSQKQVERYLEENKITLSACRKVTPEDFKTGENYKIMKRTVITTISEWEEVK